MSATQVMLVKSIGTSTKEGRRPVTLRAAAQHNKRDGDARLAHRGMIDTELSRLNYSLAGADDPAGVVSLAQARMQAVDYVPRRKDYVQAVEFVFSLPPDTSVDHRAFFARCVGWLGDRFGQENILSADVHLDQGHPHCHALLCPILGGRWVGSKVSDKGKTAEHWESFRQEVAKAFGMKVDKPTKLLGSRKVQAVAMVRHAFETETAYKGLLMSPVWNPIKEAFERDPGPFMVSLGLPLPDDPPRKMRTMAEIFTSRGKGPRKERDESRRRTVKTSGFGGALRSGSKNETSGFGDPEQSGEDTVETSGFGTGVGTTETYPVGFARSPHLPHSRLRGQQSHCEAADAPLHDDEGVTRIRDGDVFPDEMVAVEAEDPWQDYEQAERGRQEVSEWT